MEELIRQSKQLTFNWLDEDLEIVLLLLRFHHFFTILASLRDEEGRTHVPPTSLPSYWLIFNLLNDDTQLAQVLSFF